MHTHPAIIPPLTDEQLLALSELRRTCSRHGPGLKACVVVVDMQRCFIKEDDPDAISSVDSIAVLLGAARSKHVPVFLAKVIYDTEDEINLALRTRYLKAARSCFRGEPLAEITPKIVPKATDIQIEKKHASCFTASDLKQEIDRMGVDTVFLAGTSTSGCIRATAIDGAALGLRMIVVEEAVHDPRPISGPVALAELADRYADVVSLTEASEYFDTL